MLTDNMPFRWPKNKITELFQIEHPIVQAGMVWVSGNKLVTAASEAGCLGLIGAGSMGPDLFRSHIQKTKKNTKKSFGVNIPLFEKYAESQINVALEEDVKIFFTSAGSPKTWTQKLKKENRLVVHVVSNPEFAKKSEDCGVDAVVIEGFEAGGHNGRDELTTLVLLQQIQNKLSIPVIAAGGIGTGSAILAAFALGADGVQIGTAFAATAESSAHQNFKSLMCKAKFNSTFLKMKKLMPVRLLDNPFSIQVSELEDKCATKEEMADLLGKGRAKLGMFSGDLNEGELETGQIVSEIKEILTCQQLIKKLQAEFLNAKTKIL